MKQLLMLQFFGIGDCCYSQGVAQKFIDDGYSVLWPVMPNFVEGLSRAYPHITWVPYTLFKPEIFNIKEDKEIDGMRIFPMRWSDQILGIESRYWMKAKHLYAGLDPEKWKDHAMWKRDPQKEKELRQKYIVAGEVFALVNKTYRSDFTGKIQMGLPEGIKIVEMEVLPGYSLFDWAGLIERASYIHIVNSSALYMLELLYLAAIETHIYVRKPDEVDFKYVDYIMSSEKNYILHL